MYVFQQQFNNSVVVSENRLAFMKKQIASTIPTKWGVFEMIAYANSPDENMPHLALVHEGFKADSQPVWVRFHSECLTGDLFGSKRCDCGEQLSKSMQMVAEHKGILIYMRQEGRGIGLINKLKAYNLQDSGLNTADANTHLGLEVDSRQYDIAIKILKDLSVSAINLITNNPLKINAIEDSSIEIVNRIPIIIEPIEENEAYLKTKEELMGHMLHANGRKNHQ